jgi:glycosyltransferase involved in cell wall biosynthesis
MQLTPLVSVIINCYNSDKYLKTALDSVYAQTYENWEIIFWDNASSDESANIALSYDKKIKYFRADKTLPLYEARGIAVKKAKGDFIAFLDCDDWWDKEKLKKQLPLFENPAIGFVYGHFWVENELKHTRKIVSQKLHIGTSLVDDLLKQYSIGMLTLIIRRSSYKNLEQGFDKRFSVIGDFDIVLRLAAEFKSSFIDEPIGHYRWHGENYSITNIKESGEELTEWYSSIQLHSVISKSKELYNIPIMINYSKGMYYMKKGLKAEGFKFLLKIPFFRKEKIKIITAFILPKFVFKFLIKG